MGYRPPSIEIWTGDDKRNKCPMCKEAVTKGQTYICYVSSEFRGHVNLGQVHATCFIKQNLDKLNLKEILALGGI